MSTSERPSGEAEISALVIRGAGSKVADRDTTDEDRDRLQDQLQEALAEANHAKADQVLMARDVATMFDELKAMADRHADIHADKAQLQAELEQARAALARARRSWWHRWLKR